MFFSGTRTGNYSYILQCRKVCLQPLLALGHLLLVQYLCLGSCPYPCCCAFDDLGNLYLLFMNYFIFITFIFINVLDLIDLDVCQIHQIGSSGAIWKWLLNLQLQSPFAGMEGMSIPTVQFSKLPNGLHLNIIFLKGFFLSLLVFSCQVRFGRFLFQHLVIILFLMLEKKPAKRNSRRGLPGYCNNPLFKIKTIMLLKSMK